MSLARNVATVGTATVLSRLLGFARDVGIADVLGAGVLSDAFFAALLVPNLFRRLLAEGALNSAFVPIWLRIRTEEGPAGARRFGEGVLGIMLVVLGVLALLCMLLAPLVVRLVAPGFDIGGARYPLAVEYVRLAVPYIAVAGLVAIAAATLNAEGRVAAAAFGVVTFNVVMLGAIAFVLLFGARQNAGAVLSLSVVLAGLLQLALVGGAAARLPAPPLRPRIALSPQVRRFFSRALPGVIASGAPQLILIAGAMVASASQASVSWLYYAYRLYELPLGMVSIAIAAVLVPAIAAGVRSGRPDEIAAAQSRGLEIALGLALPSAVGLAVLATPIAGGLFERGAFGPRDTVAVAAALAAISVGLPGHVLEKVFGAVSFANEDTRTPMLAALAGLAAAIAGALLLFPRYGHVGVAAAIAVSGWVGAGVLGTVLLQRHWLRFDATVRQRLPRIVLATVVMGAIVLGAHVTISGLAPNLSSLARIVGLALLIAIGLVVYLTGLQLLGVARWRELSGAIRQRL